MNSNFKKDFKEGLRGGIAIGVGYFAVSFSFGILAVAGGLSVFQALLISMTNVTSAGQFAGLTIITSMGGAAEMALTQLVINMRYALMSFSLSQKIAPEVGGVKRSIMAFTNTDEIFAVASGRKEKVTFAYMEGLSLAPFIGWTGGTLFGAVAGEILPAFLCNALGIALYSMLISIVMPSFADKKSVRFAVIMSVLLSLALTYIPVLSGISSGFAIVICTVTASCLAALIFPVCEEEMN